MIRITDDTGAHQRACYAYIVFSMTASGNAHRNEQRANKEKQAIEVRGKYEKTPQQRARSFYLALETAASGKGYSVGRIILF